MNEFSIVLVINRGSSSIKFSVLDASDCEVLISGVADGINSENVFLSVNGEELMPLARHDYGSMLKAVTFELEKRNLDDNVALIGHRTTYDDSIFTESAIITDEVIDNIHHVSPLTPLHNYANLGGIESAQQLFPDVTQVTVFGTNFHQTMALEAHLYGLSQKCYEELGVRRYGFHDTSRRYVSQRTYSLLNLAEDDSGLVMAHLGNDTSICAVRNDQSVDTSMGTTPLEGLMMGTCDGGVDFGAASWVTSQTNQGLEGLECVVNRESGLSGISGLSLDLRVLEKVWHKSYEHVQLAIKTFAHRTVRHIAGYAASSHRLGGIIFTGGIGENSSLVRRLAMEHLAVLGVEIDIEVNNRSSSLGERTVSSENAYVICTVVPTNEEKVIALDAIHLGKVSAPIEFT